LPLLLCLAFAPAPFSRPSKSKPAPPTEVLVQVIGGLDRIDLTFGAKKTSIEPDGQWQENLAASLRSIRERYPGLRLLILRCDVEAMNVGDYIQVNRICQRAGFPKVVRRENVAADR